MTIYFTSDEHFFHTNIIKHCNRPFKDAAEMNYVIIQKFNERVKENDTVFFLGDFCWNRKETNNIEKQLNGKHIFIKGNHDKKEKYLLDFETNELVTKNPTPKIFSLVLGYNGKLIKLMHNPIDAELKYSINLCGHVHDKWKFKRLSPKSIVVNVSVDVWDFYPVTFEEIEQAVKVNNI